MIDVCPCEWKKLNTLKIIPWNHWNPPWTDQKLEPSKCFTLLVPVKGKMKQFSWPSKVCVLKIYLKFTWSISSAQQVRSPTLLPTLPVGRHSILHFPTKIWTVMCSRSELTRGKKFYHPFSVRGTLGLSYAKSSHRYLDWISCLFSIFIWSSE